jgi:uncharacterized protein (UPF0335 family)
MEKVFSMNEDDSKVLKSLNISITDKDNQQKVKKVFDELISDGFDEISIEIKASAENAAKNSGFDMKVFNKIKEVQGIPGWVVLNFLSSEGKLSASDFRNRFLDARHK